MSMDEDDISGFLDPDQMGRGGGIVAMLLGAILVGAAVYMWIAGHVVLLGSLGVGILGAVIVVMGIVGLRRGIERARKPPGMSLAALRSVVETQELGFWVCIRCRVLMPRNLSGDCLECGSKVDCLEVATDEDRRTALSAIPREE